MTVLNALANLVDGVKRAPWGEFHYSWCVFPPLKDIIKEDYMYSIYFYIHNLKLKLFFFFFVNQFWQGVIMTVLANYANYTNWMELKVESSFFGGPYTTNWLG
jgi:hypothetical protein